MFRQRLKKVARSLSFLIRKRTESVRIHPDYEGVTCRGRIYVLSGTGAYANATGTGTIESAPNPFKGVNLLDIKLVVKTPGA